MKRIYLIGFMLALLLGMSSVAVAANGGAPRLATLSGANEVSGGDPDGTGSATIWLNHGQGTICWEISYANLDPTTAAHIHAAPAGVNGSVVVPLSPISGGCTHANPDLIKAIIQNPANYYVNVHTTVHPGGAIRGQLSNPGQNQ
jgi:hypothetical protein